MSNALEKYLRLKLDPDKVEATLRIDPGFEVDDVTPESLRAFLDSKAISQQAIDSDAIAELAKSACENADSEEFQEAVVARGTPVEHGLDGRFDFAPHVELLRDQIERRAKAAKNRRFKDQEEAVTAGDNGNGVVDDEYAINFYDDSSFIVVRKGEPIGRIEPPTPGVDGVDVSGNAIAARQGQSADIKIGAGTTETSSGVISAVAGKLSYDAGEIRVDDTLDIQGSVDFSTGNIKFPGDVIIHKGVRDKFEVNAQGNVRIDDLVEAATIRTASDLTLRGGMAGRGSGEIDVQRVAAARYLDGVVGRVGGDLCVEREISNCNLLIAKRIESPNCTIRGGEVRVGRRIEVAQIGGEGEIETGVVLGVIPELEDLCEPLSKIVNLVVTRHSEAQIELDELKQADSKSAAISEKLTEVTFDISSTETHASEIRSRLQTITGSNSTQHLATLVARRAIYPGVTIWMSGWKITLNDTLKGPVVIDLSPEGEVQYTPLGSDGPSKPLAGVAMIVSDDRVPRLTAIDEKLAAVA
ncbi:MAG: FapA family protein [Planctomycetota bacterium]